MAEPNAPGLSSFVQIPEHQDKGCLVKTFSVLISLSSSELEFCSAAAETIQAEQLFEAQLLRAFVPTLKTVAHWTESFPAFSQPLRDVCVQTGC